MERSGSDKKITKTMIYKLKDLPDIEDIESIFFVGIKGVGMMPLSLIANDAGIDVAGADVDEEFITDKYLKISKIRIYKGFRENDIAEFFKEKDINKCLVVTTGAHKGFDNPIAKYAMNIGVEVLSQGQALGLFMDGNLFGRDFRGIAVAGSHGKTTISSLLASTLTYLGDECTYSVGTGEVFPLGSPGRLGRGAYFVAEADEYASEPVHDRVPKFLYLRPKYAIFNNIDFDHPDLFNSIDDIEKAFAEFANGIRSGGILFANGDDQRLKKIKRNLLKDVRVIFYGEGEENDYQIAKIVSFGLESKFTVYKKGAEIGVFELSIPGLHNAKNALSVVALLLELGFEKNHIRECVKKFLGTKRRLERVGLTQKGALIIDDYGHHPLEISATIATIKEAYPGKKLTCVFQPHTFSRTKALLEDFGKSFQKADKLIILPVFKSQRDTEEDTLTGENYLSAFEKYADTSFFNEFLDVIEYFEQKLDSPGDILLTIGAGDVYKIGYKLKND